MEGALAHAYSGGWPARIARAVGFQRGVRTLHHGVALASWPPNAPRLRLAFASDFHAGPTTHPRLLDDARDALANAKPDVLLLGGDYVFLDAREIEALAERFASVPAPHGRYAVMGNHDLWADDRRIARAFERSGVRVLVNEEVRLAAPFDHVVVSGLDEPWVGKPDPSRAIVAEPPVTRVLLMHAPSGLLAIGERPFDVAFCGHTHGGHIALPGGVPIVATGPLSRRYSHGRFRVARRASFATLFVSRGIGGSEVPVRLFAEPDVIVCDAFAAASPLR
jgi:predicted MPP superfamily phosphohydrolase